MLAQIVKNLGASPDPWLTKAAMTEIKFRTDPINIDMIAASRKV